jgi:hypothetical protein
MTSSSIFVMDKLLEIEEELIKEGARHADIIYATSTAIRTKELIERRKILVYEMEKKEKDNDRNSLFMRETRAKRKEEKEEELRSISEKGEVPEEDRCQHFDRRFKEPKQCPRERKKPTNYCVEHFSTHMKKTNDIMKVIPV